MQTASVETLSPVPHLPLVRRVAERIARRLPQHVDVEDLVGAGTLGLLDACAKFDPVRCDRFAPYAEIRIRGAILDSLRAMDWVPRSVRQKHSRVSEQLARLASALGRAPTSTEAAKHLGVTEGDLADLQRDVDAGGVISADELTQTGIAAFAIDEGELQHERVSSREEAARVRRALAKLSRREREVLSLYYVEELKLREIGDIFGVTESRVCQIHTQAIARLREILDAQSA